MQRGLSILQWAKKDWIMVEGQLSPHSHLKEVFAENKKKECLVVVVVAQ